MTERYHCVAQLRVHDPLYTILFRDTFPVKLMFDDSNKINLKHNFDCYLYILNNNNNKVLQIKSTC